ncbi:AraC family L-rhamnose operon transcriptional activator RhaR [Thermocatellispora tengchongensis]|uniref:AraC family L-rhamnose operon transcriptional activator RhaR n=1 Tax=Thermocatellispora tengchongensis TaxID=1073253 RepID=A0A840PKE0_9ACTN|nr:AraC family transcriptional regulator [Thermocatellispora tengchongensis]MBB5139562.1 AraC family L-rhamnose operon transcriptional activator RhaR [Thermocatellispora tengchongensis]
MREPPVGATSGLFYFTDGTLAYAGHWVHENTHPVHTHSFVEITLAVGGEGVHHSVAGRQRLRRGDVILLRPGVWHGYEECRGLDMFNCCFSSQLLHRELAWTREDPLLGYLLWTGPYSLERRGVLTAHLDPFAFEECLVHLDALDELGRQPAARHRGDVIGRLSLFLSHLARAAAQTRGKAFDDAGGPIHPAVVQGMRLLETRLDHRWTLSELAEELHLAPGYLVRLFKSSVGLPPMAYLAQQRAETAAALLLGTGQSVSEIGQSVGWSDQNYFARRFKAHFGMSATAYRARFSSNAFRLAEHQ